MLRLLVIIMLLANGAYYAWSHDFLRSWGWGSTPQTEPQRLAQQIDAQRVQVQKAQPTSATVPTPPTAPTSSTSPVLVAAASVSNAINAPKNIAAGADNTSASGEFICVTAGPLTDKQSAALKETLSALKPPSAWRLDTTTLPARWIVYMGKYPDNETRELKKTQLSRIKVPFQALTEKSLEPGLSLGSHASQAAANQALAGLVKKGVRTAWVLQESAEQSAKQLVIPSVNDFMPSQLDSVKQHLAGKPLRPCN